MTVRKASDRICANLDHARLTAAAGIIILLAGTVFITGCQAEKTMDSKTVPLQGPQMKFAQSTTERIFRFEEPADLDAWTFNHPKNLTKELSDAESGEGGKSMKVTYDPGYNWPSAMLVRPKDGAVAAPGLVEFFEKFDSEEYDTLAMKIRNPSDLDIFMNINRMPFRVPANSVFPFEIPIEQLADDNGGERTGVKTIQMTGFPEQGKFTVYFDDVSLVKKADNRAWAAAQVLEKARKRAKQTGGNRFVLGVESAMLHVFPEFSRYTPPFKDKVALTMARNESESFQAVVVPLAGALEDVTWTVPKLVNAEGRALPASVRVVGYVWADPVIYKVPSVGGWYPDLLVDAAKVAHLPAETNLSLWVKVEAPADAAPGEYRGTLTVNVGGAKPQEIAIRAEVQPFTLPTTPTLRQAYSLNDRPDMHFFHKIYPADRVPEMREKFEDMLLGEYRMDINNIYRHTPPMHWDAARLRELRDMGLTGIALGQFAQHPEHFPPMNPDIEVRIAEIKEYLKVVDEAGVRDLCYFYGFDEASEKYLPLLYETTARLKQEFPDIPFLTAANAYQQIVGALAPEAVTVDWWTPISNAFFFGEPTGRGNIEKARELGRGIWWYICNMSPAPEPNFDIDLLPLESRILLGSLSAKYDVMGFLYYALNYYGNNALPADTTRLPFVEWNPNGISVPDRYNGQGILIVPGPEGPIPTIRMEMIRDGLEDFDYYSILRQSGPEGTAIAQVPAEVARNGWFHTVNPAVLEAERQRLAQAIIRLGLPGAEGQKPIVRTAPSRPQPPVSVAPNPPGVPDALPLALDPNKSFTLRLELPGYIRLINLAEIEVFSGGENIARRGTAHMSSQAAAFPAANLITGVTTGKAADKGGMAHTPHEKNPWAEIALPPTAQIDRIVVWNRYPEGEDIVARLVPFELTLRDGDGKVVWRKFIRHARVQTLTEARSRGDNRFQKIEISSPTR
jgi:hypothetical protein